MIANPPPAYVVDAIRRVYQDVAEGPFARWADAHDAMVTHWEAIHPDGENAPCLACLPLLADEDLAFQRLTRLEAVGLEREGAVG